MVLVGFSYYNDTHYCIQVKGQENWFAKAAKACDIDLDRKWVLHILIVSSLENYECSGD